MFTIHSNRTHQSLRDRSTSVGAGLLAALISCQGTAPNADLAAAPAAELLALTAGTQGTIHPQKDGGKCLDVREGSQNNGAAVVLSRSGSAVARTKDEMRSLPWDLQ